MGKDCYFEISARRPRRAVWIETSVGNRRPDLWEPVRVRLDSAEYGVAKFRSESRRLDIRPGHRAHCEAMVVQCTQEVAMLKRVLAGEQFDDSLIPPEQRAPADTASQVTEDVTAGQEDAIPAGSEIPVALTAEDVQAAVDAKQLDSLDISRQWGRPAVREWLRANLPAFTISDQRLAAAIAHRKRETTAVSS